MPSTDYSTEIQQVISALVAVFENKEANKVDDITGDFSTDFESYPTAKAVKQAYGTRVTSWSANPSDYNIPSEALVKDALDTISSFKFIEIGTSKPSIASADTMGKLYIVSENSKVNVYYTKATTTGGSTTYSWEKLDANILDEYVVNWSDIQNKPSFGTGANDFAEGNHHHGEIRNSGEITTTVDMATTGTADKILIADASDSNKVKVTSSIPASQIVPLNTTISGIGSNLANQEQINVAIGSKFNRFVFPTTFVQEVNSLPNASDETLGMLYAVPLASSNGTYDNYAIYVTVEHKGSTKLYRWERLDVDASGEVKTFASQLADAIGDINPSS